MIKPTKQVHVHLDYEIYEKCRELIGFGVYKSLSELVRDGIDECLKKNAGYKELVVNEAISRFGEDDLAETRVRIDGAIMGMRINARWWHTEAKTQLHQLIEDLHIPGPIEEIEEKYGTKIELFQLSPQNPDI